MNLPPLPVPTLPMDAAHTWALAAYYKALEKDGPDIDKSKSALEMAIRTYAEQYGRLCADAEREACAQLVADLRTAGHLCWDGNYMRLYRERPEWANDPRLDGDTSLVERAKALDAIRARSQR